jgi:Tfp pilus assembly protein PilN
MPPRKVQRSEKQQTDHFRMAAQRLMDAGELDRTEADATLESLSRIVPKRDA